MIPYYKDSRTLWRKILHIFLAAYRAWKNRSSFVDESEFIEDQYMIPCEGQIEFMKALDKEIRNVKNSDPL